MQDDLQAFYTHPTTSFSLEEKILNILRLPGRPKIRVVNLLSSGSCVPSAPAPRWLALHLIVAIVVTADIVAIVVTAIRDIIQSEVLSFLLDRSSAGLWAAGTSLPCGRPILWLIRSGCGLRHVVEMEVDAVSSASSRS